MDMPDKPPLDPADHAEEFAHTWVDRLENHEEALALAPQTTRPISEAARRILRAMERGWKH